MNVYNVRLYEFAIANKLCYPCFNYLLIVLQQKSGVFPALFCCYSESKCQEDTMSKVPSVIEPLVTPIVEELNLELVDVEFVKEGRNWFLRIYVDTPEGGIDIDQCAQVSERLSAVLDEKDPIEQNYYLEVSSPGAERPLKKESDFEKSIGKFIYVKTYEPIKDMKEFEGYLTAYTEEGLELDMRIKTRKLKIMIPKEKIALARLAIDFSA